MAPELVHHVHGKSRVRVARTWREGAIHHFVEWNVDVIIESDMAHAYKTSSNEGMTATDTTKNQCYVVARRLRRAVRAEVYALALARQFLDTYPLISAVHVRVEQQPWRRVEVMGRPHDHGFAAVDLGVRVASALARRDAAPDELGRTRRAAAQNHAERVRGVSQRRTHGVARHAGSNPGDGVGRRVVVRARREPRRDRFRRAVRENHARVDGTLLRTSPGGVYSPSVQHTLYQMGAAVVERAKEVRQVTLTAPNLHFIPRACREAKISTTTCTSRRANRAGESARR